MPCTSAERPRSTGLTDETRGFTLRVQSRGVWRKSRRTGRRVRYTLLCFVPGKVAAEGEHLRYYQSQELASKGSFRRERGLTFIIMHHTMIQPSYTPNP